MNSGIQSINGVLGAESLQKFIEWVFLADDAELDALKVDELFSGETMQRQIEEAYAKQIEEFKESGADYSHVAITMNSIIAGVNDIIDEFNVLTDEDLSPSKRKTLAAFFSLMKEMAEKVLGSYPREDAEIFIELINPNAQVPQYKNSLDCGADVYSPEDYVINPGETIKIATGFKVSIPKDWKLSVRPRSGLSLNTKMRIANAPGTIEPNYLDEVGIIVDNIGEVPITIKAGERPCQLILERRYTAKYTVVSNVADYASGNRGGGFGHTGK